MNLNLQFLKNKFPFFEKELLNEMLLYGVVQEVPQGMEVVRYGQYLKMLPIVLDGIVKAYSQYEDKEFLLYYIQPNESCIMSLSAVLNNKPSRILAITGTDVIVIMLPADKIKKWISIYASFNSLFYSLYDNRYSELVDTLNQVLFERLDKRICEYLKEKSKVTGLKKIKVTHKVIALEMGTAREVVSRVLKKLENNNKIIQEKGYIELL